LYRFEVRRPTQKGFLRALRLAWLNRGPCPVRRNQASCRDCEFALRFQLVPGPVSLKYPPRALAELSLKGDIVVQQFQVGMKKAIPRSGGSLLEVMCRFFWSASAMRRAACEVERFFWALN
jgi:hypothetical protein